ncbi:hypothetical protein [Clostridium phage Maintenon]|nr:hypothetical protein [Clostridium phage Maintenon]
MSIPLEKLTVRRPSTCPAVPKSNYKRYII